MSQVLLVCLPKNKDKGNATFTAVANGMAESCRCSKFDIPSLVVGTLDSLLGLSDDLTKSSMQVENAVKKLERTYQEIAGADAKPLRVKETAVEAFFQAFQWDFAQFQHQGKALAEIVAQVQAIAGKTEDELKMLTTAFQEKTVALAAAKRRKIINLSTSDLEDFLRPEDLAKADLQNSEHLITVAIALPKSLEAEFLQTYASLGADIAAFGNPDWTAKGAVGADDGKFGPALDRVKVRGSPVVPGSAKRMAEEGDQVLYAVTVLKGHYQAGVYVDDVFSPGHFVDYLEPLKAACREKRLVLREIVFDSSRAGGVDAAIEQATSELKQARAMAVRWCRAHFGEALSAFTHLKVVQAFVEAVLLYGLPADFVAFFATFDAKAEKEVKAKLVATVLAARPDLRPKRVLAVEEDEGDEEAALPFVCLKFSMIGTSTAGP